MAVVAETEAASAPAVALPLWWGEATDRMLTEVEAVAETVAPMAATVACCSGVMLAVAEVMATEAAVATKAVVASKAAVTTKRVLATAVVLMSSLSLQL
jgi:hypothetical protein